MANHHRRRYPYSSASRKFFFSAAQWQVIFTDTDYGLLKDITALFYRIERRALRVNTVYRGGEEAFRQWRVHHPGKHLYEAPQEVYHAHMQSSARTYASSVCEHFLREVLMHAHNNFSVGAQNMYFAAYLWYETLPQIAHALRTYPPFPYEWRRPKQTHHRRQVTRDYAIRRRLLLHLRADIEELLVRWKYPAWQKETSQRHYSPRTGRLVESPTHPKKPRTVRKILARPRQSGEGVFMGGYLDT